MEMLLDSRKRRIEASGRYIITSGYEDTNADVVLTAQRIHAISYVESGYVKPQAVCSDGTLCTEIDQSRGLNVEYLLVTDPKRPNLQASVRVIHIPVDGSVEDLPFFHHSKEYLYEETIKEIHGQIATKGVNSVLEISALSKTDVNPVSSESSLVLVRELIQRAVKGKTREKWLVVFAEPAYNSFVNMFGNRTVRRAGRNVPIGDNDNIQQKDLKLVPVLLEPCSMTANFYAELNEIQTDRKRHKQCRMFTYILNFMTYGLSNEEIGCGHEKDS